MPAKFAKELANRDKVLTGSATYYDSNSAVRQIADMAFEHKCSVFKHRNDIMKYLGIRWCRSGGHGSPSGKNFCRRKSVFFNGDSSNEGPREIVFGKIQIDSVTGTVGASE